MGTILVETGSFWRRIFLLDRVIASEEQKAGLSRILQSRVKSYARVNSIVLTVGP
jgi:hypothetical protein